jgi:hypothetical protein
MRKRFAAVFILAAVNCPAARLSPSSALSFERYVADLETRLVRQHAQPETYLAALDIGADQRSGWERQLKSGGIQIEPVNGGAKQLDAALLHHWRASAFVPNARANDMRAHLLDSDHLAGHYASEVVWSRALTKSGDSAILAVRFKKEMVITVVLDAEYQVEARLTGEDRGLGISRSTHFWQVDDPGTSRERRRPEGDDDGFLWRLNAYWSFVHVPEGLLIECEAVSLTRDIPLGLSWLITPIVGEFPRELLASTMKATKEALTAIVARRQPNANTN